MHAWFIKVWSLNAWVLKLAKNLEWFWEWTMILGQLISNYLSLYVIQCFSMFWHWFANFGAFGVMFWASNSLLENLEFDQSARAWKFSSQKFCRNCIMAQAADFTLEWTLFCKDSSLDRRESRSSVNCMQPELLQTKGSARATKAALERRALLQKFWKVILCFVFRSLSFLSTLRHALSIVNELKG